MCGMQSKIGGGVMGTVYLSVWVDSFVSLFMLL